MYYIDPDLKQKIVKLYIQDGRTFGSLADEYGFTSKAISHWVKAYRENAATNVQQQRQLADMELLRNIQKEVEELRKENDFLKKAAAFFAKESK